MQYAFVFDTGMGINLISKDMCKNINCQPAGTFKGKRMSGRSQAKTKLETRTPDITQHFKAEFLLRHMNKSAKTT